MKSAMTSALAFASHFEARGAMALSFGGFSTGCATGELRKRVGLGREKFKFFYKAGPGETLARSLGFSRVPVLFSSVPEWNTSLRRLIDAGVVELWSLINGRDGFSKL